MVDAYLIHSRLFFRLSQRVGGGAGREIVMDNMLVMESSNPNLSVCMHKQKCYICCVLLFNLFLFEFLSFFSVESRILSYFIHVQCNMICMCICMLICISLSICLRVHF